MKCPSCGKQTRGVNHNERGLRCTFCWALLPNKPPKPRRKRKARLPTEVELAAVLTEASSAISSE